MNTESIYAHITPTQKLKKKSKKGSTYAYAHATHVARGVRIAKIASISVYTPAATRRRWINGSDHPLLRLRQSLTSRKTATRASTTRKIP